MTWIDTLLRRWAPTSPATRSGKKRRFRPIIEMLEARDVPTAGLDFLQGYAFIDVNGDGLFNTGDLPKVGAQIRLATADGEGGGERIAITDGSGYYRFTGLTPGAAYTLTELTPSQYTATAVEAQPLLSSVNLLSNNSVEVILPSISDTLQFNRTSGASTASPTAFTLTGGVLNEFTSQSSSGNSHQYEGYLSTASTQTSEFLTYCMDLFHANPQTFSVVLSSDPFIPSGFGLSPTTAENLGRIAYLYNTYGREHFTGPSATANEAGLGLAFYELLYDATPNLASGNFVVLSASSDPAYIAAQGFLNASAGKNQSAFFMSVTTAPDTPPNFSSSQGMIGTELYNFANVPTVPPPAAGSLAGVVFQDCDGDGVQSVNESGIKGVTLTLNGPGGTRIAVTDITGHYSFTDLLAGTYTLTETQPAGFNQGTNRPGSPPNGTVNGDTISGIVVTANSLVGYTFAEHITEAAVQLDLTKTADKSVYLPGQSATYTYTITNNSPVTVTDVKVIDDNATPDKPSDDFTVVSGLTLMSGETRTFQVTRSLPVSLVQVVDGVALDAGYLTVERLASGDYKLVFVQSQANGNDSRYGTGAVPGAGWSKSRGFSSLVGSDMAGFEFTDANGQVVLAFRVDTISAATGATFPSGSVSYPSGYGTLGVTGGEGRLLSGNSSHILFATTAITENLKKYPVGYLVNSPAETFPGSGVSADPNAPDWDYDNSFTVIISQAAFGAAGFGGVRMTDIHNSPGKNGVERGPGTPVPSTVTNIAVASGQVCAVVGSDTASATVQVQPTGGGGTTSPAVRSSISSDFNNTQIAAGTTIWFSAIVDPGSLPKNEKVTLTFANAKITYTDTSSGSPVVKTIAVPSSIITFDPNVKVATTTFNTAENRWETTVPLNVSGNIFLTGVPFVVPVAIKGGAVKSITFEGDFSTSSSKNIDVKWKWSAAVYNTQSNQLLFQDYNAIGVKPVDDDKTSAYKNKNAAGTPENRKSLIIAGARGNGGTNYTGSYTSAITVKLAPSSSTSTSSPILVGSAMDVSLSGAPDSVVTP